MLLKTFKRVGLASLLCASMGITAGADTHTTTDSGTTPFPNTTPINDKDTRNTNAATTNSGTRNPSAATSNRGTGATTTSTTDSNWNDSRTGTNRNSNTWTNDSRATGVTATGNARQNSSLSGGVTTHSVRDAQTQLNTRGYTVSVDGIMGPQTARAIRSFQAEQGLRQTGMLDQQTMSALKMQSDSVNFSVWGACRATRVVDRIARAHAFAGSWAVTPLIRFFTTALRRGENRA